MRKFCYCLILIVSLNESIFSQRDKDEFSNPTFTSALNKYADKKYSEAYTEFSNYLSKFVKISRFQLKI